MNDIEKNDDLNEEISEDSSYITLTDDDGQDVHFEVIDEFPYKDKNYVVLLPFEDLDDEVVILEAVYSENPDENEYYSVEDESLLNEIFEEFLKRDEEE